MNRAIAFACADESLAVRDGLPPQSTFADAAYPGAVFSLAHDDSTRAVAARNVTAEPIRLTLDIGVSTEVSLAVWSIRGVGLIRPGGTRANPTATSGCSPTRRIPHPSTRIELRCRGIKHTIPERSDQIARRKVKASA